MSKPYVFILHPTQKALVDALLGDPAPTGEAAITKGLLQAGEIRYVGELGRVDDHIRFIKSPPPDPLRQIIWKGRRS